MAKITGQDDYQKTALRVPRDLHAKIIEAAKANNRTMNAEIIARLERSFYSYAELGDSTNEEMTNILKKALKNLINDGIIAVK